jgi:hypothetical protein
MTSEELSHEVAATIAACHDRIVGVGKAQYDDGKQQRFEKMTPAEILSELQEEAEDLIVYAVMARIRVQNMIDRLEKI